MTRTLAAVSSRVQSDFNSKENDNESNPIDHIGPVLFARNRPGANQFTAIAAHRRRAVQAGVEFAHQLPVRAGVVARREVRHLGALGAAMPAGTWRLVCAQYV